MALSDYLAEEVAVDHAAGLLPRREALRRLGLLGLGLSAATALLVACGDGGGDAADTPRTTGSTSGAAPTSSTSPTPSATPEDITFGPRGELRGVYAQPASPRGAVLVIHENRGLTDHIRTIPPRLAADGYAALAIDLLSDEGGTAAVGDEGAAIAALAAAPEDRLVAKLRFGLDELARRAPQAKLGVIGFCFGGGMVWKLLAAGEPRLAAAAPFYGPAPANPDFSGSSNAAVLAVYAARDDRVNATRTAAVGALDTAGLPTKVLTLPDADHAFFNDTGPRYNAKAAATAYRAVLDWFGEHLA
jgi:carboxymethylenebutenolidase